MSRIKLETHQIEMRPKGKPHDAALNLWDLDGHGLALSALIMLYVQWLDTIDYADDERKRVFAFDGTHAELSPNAEFLCGRFEYGTYGISNSIKNVRTKEVAHPKRMDESEVYPLYFLLYAPRGERKAALVLQRYGDVAMLTQFKLTFARFLSEQYGLIPRVEPLTPIEVLRAYVEKGTVEELVLKRVDIPYEEAERIKAGGLTNHPKSITVRLRGKGILARDTLVKWLDERHAVFVVEDLSRVGLDGDHSTTVKVNVGGAVREIDFSDTGKIRPYIDIHSEDLLDKSTGHAIFGEINRIAKEYALEILKPGVEQD